MLPSHSTDQHTRRNHEPPQFNQAGCAACEIAQRYMSLIEAEASVIVCLSPDYRILEFNHAAERLYGQRRAAVLGRDFRELFLTEAQRNTAVGDIKQVLDGHSTLQFESSVRTPWGKRRVLLWCVNRVLDARGQTNGVIAVGQDITEHKQAEHALTEHKRQLQTLVTELALAGRRERRRVSIVLHDNVGQALAMAKLKLCTVLDLELSADVRRALEESRVLLDQSIQATRSLTFKWSSAVLEQLGLEAALQQLVEWFNTQQSTTLFVFQTENQAKPVGEVQGSMLYDIARELLFNASKHAQARTVSLTLKCVDDKLYITVIDDGIGFDKACLVEQSSAKGRVGYFYIRERLACLGGKLEVESSIGRGTQIVVAVPTDKQ